MSGVRAARPAARVLVHILRFIELRDVPSVASACRLLHALRGVRMACPACDATRDAVGDRLDDEDDEDDDNDDYIAIARTMPASSRVLTG